ncbi:E3 ubiquitin ligase involved in syntaxin degradation protein [Dioscorea alata]|uniref:E3 ubiquitin ligase involved in syntaxin degradation protein n=12 Tax=Dioscorea alata TaxID=55571 RepID=A0ACB7VF38_DIOAL|nr:E3 ubiquitin ligase involved in syntaxin degradation protein [Dioscorea alata]KAH7672311.1 E3 ubiquitin ligase involved in syntaxin degradation protein [Dioscorea alata]KAH7672312.1 E3 ubiquitin ligase involved in syntaxin degradation protein [Dioscorea alata]KAH7672313.1 E3 ubiquitin ligase involved in syntaxin degradation protein [Dioscorea alata]KAH7672314.1 E3 ubiquitin ligase involved in syntaxin degradation protein [Dioscorea alata]
MRRLFSFKSSSGNNSNDGKLSKQEKARSSSESTQDGVHEQERHHHEVEYSSNIQLRRSSSFSYPSIYCRKGEVNLDSMDDYHIPPTSLGNSPHHKAESSIKMKTGERDSAQKLHMVEKNDSPVSSQGFQCSSGNSPYSSPVALRCRAARLTEIPSKSKVLDLYIDGEQHEMKSKKDHLKDYSDTGSDGCLAENRSLRNSGRPPRAQSTAPSSPTYNKENRKSYSSRELKDVRHQLPVWNWARDEQRLKSPQKCKNMNVDMSSHSRVPLMKLRDYDSETTTTIEDIYEDSSDPQPSLNSDGATQKYSSDLREHYEKMTGSVACADEVLSFQRQNCFPGKVWMDNRNADLVNSGLLEQDTEEELLKKAKEAEHKLVLISEEVHGLNELQRSSLNISSLLQTIKDITKDRRCLTFELSSQINCRLAEKASTREQLKQSKLDLDTRTRRLEKEKNELQLSLERELDRRSSEWSSKLEKFQFEEQRLKERVRELAEQNVALQREISSLKGSETDTKNRYINSQIQVNSLAASLEEVRGENNRLHQTLSELQERYNGAAEDVECVKRNLKETEKENMDLRKSIVRLQKQSTEQDKTISGLRQRYSDEIGNQSSERNESFGWLQIEHLRLTGVEQMLRKEVESCRHELELLRHENSCLLDRLQSTGGSCRFSLVKLDQELHGRVECLQTQGLSLLNDYNHFCEELHNLRKCKNRGDSNGNHSEFCGYSFAEYNGKHHSLRKGIENFKRALQTISEILKEKSKLHAPESELQSKECGASRQLNVQDQLELDFKAETTLNRLLREKLLSKELELEQLEAGFASSVRSHDVLQTEIQRLQDELSCLNHKTKDMEIQMLKTDESNKHLQHDLQECMKELTSTRGVLLKVSEERDHLWEEVKRSGETIIILKHEVDLLKKKIEALDEDVLIKEGQITILKDSLGDKPFGSIYSPESVKEFALE